MKATAATSPVIMSKLAPLSPRFFHVTIQNFQRIFEAFSSMRQGKIPRVASLPKKVSPVTHAYRRPRYRAVADTEAPQAEFVSDWPQKQTVRLNQNLTIESSLTMKQCDAYTIERDGRYAFITREPARA